ncbi:uncharacterized protein C1orf232 homolog [Python bivittatus]|uniref:Uncharacterized protein C1orf232 homolog n=1 Tax=Python bivittatus TaxID=176946 RepID=A0A9F5MSI8_PYTBI|nr:uncharacterized protein C1orf232 homolog [Python bivittatus]
MTQGFWKVYKAKVLQALGGELQEEDLQDERENPELVETTDSILLTEEGLNPVSQLARRVQGAGVKSWRTVSSLFSREDEDQLLAPEPCADHPLAAKPAGESPSEKKTSGLWDVFATKWQQTSALEKMAAKVDPREEIAEGSGMSGEMAAEEASDLGHDNDLREAEGVAFKWSFLTSKFTELKNKNIPKSN